MKRVGIIQPNYIPWRGYFHLIREVDVFVFLDDVQYTKQDWRNRNRIRLKSGALTWLSVPVKAKSDTPIREVEINYATNWVHKHLTALEQNYGRAPFFGTYFEPFREVLQAGERRLSDLDIRLCRLICGWLGIETDLVLASDLACPGHKDEKLIAMTRKLGGTHYLSGPAAQGYIRPQMWEAAGIGLSYMEYPAYPAYPQIARPFEPAVSVLDLLFMTGPDAPRYIWG